MKRCVIIAGAEITNYNYIKTILNDNDFYIFCDSGLMHKDKLSIVPDLIVGDFDSCANPNLNIETIVLPCEKDDTDAMFAVKTAIQRGFDDFLLLGVVGGRFDHSLVNISILTHLYEMGKTAKIIDDYSEMEFVKNTTIIEDVFSYFSLIAIGGDVEGITIKNAKYTLQDGTITMGYQYGISNEVLKGEKSYVSLKKGLLLLIKVW